MRNIIVLSVLALLGCSNDDENSSVNFESAIIGVWEIEELIENDQSIVLSECFQLNTVEFRTDGTLTFTEYLASESSGCEPESSGIDSYVITDNVIEVFYSDNGIEPNGFRDLFTILQVTEEGLVLIGSESSTTIRTRYKRIAP